MKKILSISMWLILFTGLVVLVGFIETEHKKITCKAFEVEIDYGNAEALISAADISKEIYKRFDTLVGKKISEINSVKLENYICEIDFIDEADVYTTITGLMKIKLKQRNPIVRVMNSFGQSYYIGESGKLIPVNSGYSSRVPVASGNIAVRYSDTLNLRLSTTKSELKNLYGLSTYIYNDVFLRAQIEQIYVTKAYEFELVPKVGRHLILFGDITNMEAKFDKLKIFYEKGMKKAGWNTYKTINLKFENQVICEKK
jgi:cell division protein FtsQ